MENWRETFSWGVRLWDDSIEAGDVVKWYPDADWDALGTMPDLNDIQQYWVVGTIYTDDMYGDDIGVVQVYPMGIYELGTTDDMESEGIAVPLTKWPDYLQRTGRRLDH